MEHVTLPRDLAVGLELQLELQLEVELQPKHEILQDMENVALPSSPQAAWTMLWTMRHWQWRTSTTGSWRCSVALRQNLIPSRFMEKATLIEQPAEYHRRAR